MALKGTLKDFPVSDVFQLVEQQQKSGILQLTNKAAEVRVVFDRGRVVGADSRVGKNREPLGAMLVRAGLITKLQLDGALDLQKKTLQKLGNVLVSERMISADVLRQFLELQTRKTVYRLFLWRNGEYEFLSEIPSYEKDLATPMSPQHLVMDSLRMVDEWPGVRKKIVGLDAVPGRIEAAVQNVVLPGEADDEGEPGDEVDDELDAAFAEWGGHGGTVEKQADSKIKLNELQAKVWGLIDGDRTIQDIADRALLDEFDTARALCDLIDRGTVRIIGRRKASRKDRVTALPTNRRRQIVSAVIGVAASVAIIALAAAAGVIVQFGGYGITEIAQRGPGPGRTLTGALEKARNQREIRALDVYWLMEGRYPDAGSRTKSAAAPTPNVGLAKEMR